MSYQSKWNHEFFSLTESLKAENLATQNWTIVCGAVTSHLNDLGETKKAKLRS